MKKTGSTENFDLKGLSLIVERDETNKIKSITVSQPRLPGKYESGQQINLNAEQVGVLISGLHDLFPSGAP